MNSSTTSVNPLHQTLSRSSVPRDREVTVLQGGLSPLGTIVCRLTRNTILTSGSPSLPGPQPRGSWSRSVPKVLLHNPWLPVPQAGLWPRAKPQPEKLQHGSGCGKTSQIRQKESQTHTQHPQELTSRDYQSESTFSMCSTTFSEDSITKKKKTQIF